MTIKEQRARTDLILATKRKEKALAEWERLIVRSVREGNSLRTVASDAGLHAHSAVRKIVDRLAPQLSDVLAAAESEEVAS